MRHDRAVEFGAEVDDLDAVPEALRRHRLVVVRGRRLGVDEQVALTARFGRVVGGVPGVPQVRYEDERRHPDHAFFNERWHADLSWCVEGPTITVLYGLAVGRRAAPTAFADTVTGFERLAPARCEAVSGWQAFHHVERSRVLRYGRGSPPSSRGGRPRAAARPGHDAAVPSLVAEPGACRAVVVTDPASGRCGILLGDHAWTLHGHPETEGRRLVDDLQADVVAVADRRVHQWQPGDLVVYDNRTVLHRREPTERPGRRRVLRRTVAWPDDG